MRRIKLLLVGLLVALPVVGWAAVAHAQDNFRSGNDISVAAGETVDRTLFAAGQTIDIAGTVNGDVFCAGQSITISGTVRGDVMCAGQTVQVSGQVDGDVRLAGQTVTIGGVISRNASIAGQTFTLESAAKILGDASVAGQNSTLNGFVGRDLYAGSTLLTVNGSIGRDIRSGVADMALGPNAIVAGDITYVSAHTLTRDNSAHVAGMITRQNPPQGQSTDVQWGAIIGGSLWFAVYLVAALLLVALAVVLLFPRAVYEANIVAARQPFKTFGVGLIASIVVPLVIAALMFSVIGIPLGILALMVWFVVSCLAFPAAAYYLGSLVVSDNATNPVWIMLAGAVIILVLFLIPFIGFLTWLFVMWFGTGVIVLQIPRLPRPHYDITDFARKR